jgi:hypothetical protein
MTDQIKQKTEATTLFSIITYTQYEFGSSVSVASDYGLDGRGSIPDRGRGFFL